MNEMNYTTERKMEILFSGEYKEHKFYILNLGTHPTAYVENKFQNLSSYGDERLDNIEVHGGFTYSDGAYWDKEDKSAYLGWDYAHCFDYAGYYAKYPDMYLADAHLYKRWTTSEIWEEVKSVIEQLIPLEESEGEYGRDSNIQSSS